MTTPPSPVKTMGAWDADTAITFLRRSRIPMRLAGIGARGYPILLSVWYLYDEAHLWCAVQRSSRIAGYLSEDPRCGFEIAVNDPPYRGVRGQGEAHLIPDQGEPILRALIHRYLGDDTSTLAQWLLSRAADEVAIRVKPLRFSTWDYSKRMTESGSE